MDTRKKPKKQRGVYGLWILAAPGVIGVAWLIWEIVSPDSSVTRRVVSGLALLGLVGLSSLELIFDARAKRAIRRTCEKDGASVTKIESRKTHYRVFITTSAGIESRKCLVHSGVVKWLT
jgi:hypothetical protein